VLVLLDLLVMLVILNNVKMNVSEMESVLKENVNVIRVSKEITVNKKLS
jgi:hypothetical protein